MLHRIREMVKEKSPVKLSGIVESDETYMSRKYGSDFVGLPKKKVVQKLKGKHSKSGAVLGLLERNTGRIAVKSFDSRKAELIRPAIKALVIS